MCRSNCSRIRRKRGGGERKRELCFVWNPEGEKPSVALGPLMD